MVHGEQRGSGAAGLTQQSLKVGRTLDAAGAGAQAQTLGRRHGAAGKQS
jgi:hypothetical protein